MDPNQPSPSHRQLRWKEKKSHISLYSFAAQRASGSYAFKKNQTNKNQRIGFWEASNVNWYNNRVGSVVLSVLVLMILSGTLTWAAGSRSYPQICYFFSENLDWHPLWMRLTPALVTERSLPLHDSCYWEISTWLSKLVPVPQNTLYAQLKCLWPKQYVLLSL